MRFSREAQLLASLNHPNIAQIYGLEDGLAALAPARAGEAGHYVRALVMELVECETLAERMAGRSEDRPLHGADSRSGRVSTRPIPLEEALAIARQIAEALEATHEQGVIHRDLKPTNLKVRPDGTVKVLDFGLAKAMDPMASAIANATMSPTLSIPFGGAQGGHATQAGIILGTAAYMSPEQAAGKAVDKRSDLWAFGVVLLEMR